MRLRATTASIARQQLGIHTGPRRQRELVGHEERLAGIVGSAVGNGGQILELGKRDHRCRGRHRQTRDPTQVGCRREPGNRLSDASRVGRSRGRRRSVEIRDRGGGNCEKSTVVDPGGMGGCTPRGGSIAPAAPGTPSGGFAGSVTGIS